MLSMTGFGKGSAALADGYTLAVEVSSVNRKQLEVRVTLPPELGALDVEVRKAVGAEIGRGSVQIRAVLTRGTDAAGTAEVNRALLDRLIDAALAARTAHGLSGKVAVEQLFLVPGVLTGAAVDPASPEFQSAFASALRAALAAFHRMRETEGNALRADFLGRIGELEELLRRIEPLTAGYDRIVKDKLLEKLKSENIPAGDDDDRLLKEVLFYADKADVTEEITRLHSHFVQFRNFLDDPKPAGRSLDFLMQEFFREITTLGNKVGIPEVSPLVVAFKSGLEKLREQIQNVE